MQRSVVAILFTGFLSIGALAEAKSRLSNEDQARTVCVPQRDDAGRLTGTDTCMSGRQWEIALQHAQQGRVRDLAHFRRFYPQTQWFPRYTAPVSSLRPR